VADPVPKEAGEGSPGEIAVSREAWLIWTRTAYKAETPFCKFLELWGLDWWSPIIGGSTGQLRLL
jgi:hypothetical protein